MTSISNTSRTISRRLDRLERSLAKKLRVFYNQKIKGSIIPIELLKAQHDSTIKTLIRKAVQDAYLQGTDIVAEQVTQKDPDFQLFISGIDINNIQSITNNMANQFWTTTGKLLLRESEFKQDGEKIVKKPDFSIQAAMIGLASLFTFSAFNNAVKSKLPVATATIPISQTESLNLNLGIGFEIKRIQGRVRFTTQHDAKVDQEICAPLDGTEWDEGDPDIVVPPDDTHRFCRCHLIPIVE